MGRYGEYSVGCHGLKSKDFKKKVNAKKYLKGYLDRFPYMIGWITKETGKGYAKPVTERYTYKYDKKIRKYKFQKIN